MICFCSTLMSCEISYLVYVCLLFKLIRKMYWPVLCPDCVPTVLDEDVRNDRIHLNLI